MKNLRKKFSFFPMFIISANCLFAQSNWPAPYEIKSDTANFLYLDNNNWQLLPDPSGHLTVEQVQSQAISNAFMHFPSLQQDSVHPVHTYWIRFRLKNEMPVTARVSVGSRAEEADFYISDSAGKLRHYQTGWKLRASKRDGLKGSSIIPLELSPGTELKVYYRRYSAELLPATLRMSVSGSYSFIERKLADYEKKYFSGEFSVIPFFIGFFLLAAIFNFFFFLVVRERVYLYFSLFLFFFSLANKTIVTDVLFDSAFIPYFILLRIIFLAFFCFVQFIRYYFKTFLIVPKWDKWVRLSGYLLSGYYFLYLALGDAFPNSDNWISVSLFIITLITLIITLVKVIKRSDKAGRFFLLAIAPFILVLSIILLIVLGIEVFAALTGSDSDAITEKIGDYDELISQLSVAWAAVVFSWALFNRYNAQRKEIATQALEKERIAKEKEMERNELIAAQKIILERQVEERTHELKLSLENLKATQAQLVQSEKMASLGQLTTGIAHEIQNPLNFVNNFSDVNSELIEELKTELISGNHELAIEIANDIKENEQKINQHGKRADSIVKGMLQHSRSSAGNKEMTDINALADEYLRLAYHGIRAKEKSFNAILQTDFDRNIEKINIVPQDIGRVLLNLYNNAFYAVNERIKMSGDGYEPTVSVSTKENGSKIEFKVKDNGTGIPQNIIDRIFQPFFTTKPTGQGTGLGLSLSYDIIKAYGGELKAQSREGEGAEFIIQLQIQQ